jgi:hypothetical protein
MEKFSGARKTNGKVFPCKENLWKNLWKSCPGQGKLMEKFSGARNTNGKVFQSKEN